jgi:hypothetical protein
LLAAAAGIAVVAHLAVLAVLVTALLAIATAVLLLLLAGVALLLIVLVVPVLVGHDGHPFSIAPQGAGLTIKPAQFRHVPDCAPGGSTQVKQAG